MHLCGCEIMTTEVLTCSPSDRIVFVWELMKSKAIRTVPVLDEGCRPLGVVTAGDALLALLDETSGEEQILRDYVMGFGYR